MTSAFPGVLTDPSTFRRVFADPGEPLVLVIVDPGAGTLLRTTIDGINQINTIGAQLRTIIYGASSALLESMGCSDEDISRLGLLEPGCASLLPVIGSEVNLTIALGQASYSHLSDHPHAFGRVPCIVGPGVSLDTRRRPRIDCEWDGQNARGLSDLLAHLLSPRPPQRDEAASRPHSPALHVSNYVLQNDWGIGDE
ncbi:MAG TPA: hypothetical protein VN638_01505, partial [Nitrospiraceae bacterium]|nr:hypothetical protein [Nitrospiraceae bacterium]